MSRTHVFPLGAGLRFEGCRKRGISERQNAESAVHICGKDFVIFYKLLHFMQFSVFMFSASWHFLSLKRAKSLKI